MTLDEFNEYLDQEFSIFKGDKRYDFVEDIKDALSESLSKCTAERIFNTLPNYFFWDIKRPNRPDNLDYKNQYNPARKVPFDSFFDMRQQEEFFDRRQIKMNLIDSVSTHRKY